MTAARWPRIVVTRPRAQAAAWVESLAERGIDAIALPLLEIEAVRDGEAAARLDEARQGLARFTLVVFVSVNAVLHFFASSPRWPAGVLAAAPGPGTADALRAAGVPAEAIVEPAADAAQFDSESLWLRLQGGPWAGRSVLIVRGDGGREWLAERLVEAGAGVETVSAYRRAPPAWSSEERTRLAAIVAEPAGWAWLFTSSEGIGQLVDMAAGADWAAHTAVATHARIAASAGAAGFGRVFECAAGVPALVACIQSIRP